MFSDDESLYDEEEPTFPYREKMKAYPSMSKASLSVYFLLEDISKGVPIDTRHWYAFKTLLGDSCERMSKRWTIPTDFQSE